MNDLSAGPLSSGNMAIMCLFLFEVKRRNKESRGKKKKKKKKKKEKKKKDTNQNVQDVARSYKHILYSKSSRGRD